MKEISVYRLLSLGLLVVSVLSSCAPESTKDHVAKSGGSVDFLRTTMNQAPSSEWTRPTDCRANIREVLCEVEPWDESGSVLDRRCLGGEEQYVQAFEKVYDSLDPINQKMFCSLRRIFIERELSATAYANLIYHPTEEGVFEPVPGAVIGVRRSVLEKNPDLSVWSTWKEQKNFVNIDEDFKAPLPYPVYAAQKKDVSLLQFAVVHEFGHLFDFANSLSGFEQGFCEIGFDESGNPSVEVCEPDSVNPEGFGALSWQNEKSVLPSSEFYGRDKLCFYNCDTHLSIDEIERFYSGLRASNFISSYASSSILEDFAETWATRWLIEVADSNLIMHASDSLVLNLRNKYFSAKFFKKRRYINRFLRGTINYP